jgi:uncharacterized membrane protein
MVWFWLFSSVILGATGHLLARVAVTRIGAGSFLAQALTNPWLYGAVAAYSISFMFWLLFLRNRPLVQAVPMSSLTYITVAAISVFFLGERLTSLQWAGFTLILIGATLLGR